MSVRHPSEEPTLSGDTSAVRPTTLPPFTASCGIRPESRAVLPQSRMAGAGLDRFNTAARDDAEATLLTCCGCTRWAQRIAAHRPYPDLESLLAASDEASYDLAPAEIDEALARESVSPHPLAGARGPGTLAAHTALRAAHAEYERRFRHVFVICLDGFREDEQLDQVLAAIRQRLGNDVDEERVVTADELRRLTRGRLARLAAAHR
ncbi:2-oxo-4-hydroxy-4-carboxy-5-ureidoimidazoline decarboxylase [Streptomyces natalensis]